MHQLRYPDEIKPWREVELGALPEPSARELDLAEQLVAQLRRARFDAAAYRDDVKERVRALLADKAKHGAEISVALPAKGPPVTDLMAALRASLGAEPERTHRERKPRRHARVARKRRAA